MKCPQTWKTICSGDSDGVSVPFILINISASVMLLLYAINAGAAPFVVANAAVLVNCVIILFVACRCHEHACFMKKTKTSEIEIENGVSSEVRILEDVETGASLVYNKPIAPSEEPVESVEESKDDNDEHHYRENSSSVVIPIPKYLGENYESNLQPFSLKYRGRSNTSSALPDDVYLPRNRRSLSVDERFPRNLDYGLNRFSSSTVYTSFNLNNDSRFMRSNSFAVHGKV